MTDYYESIFWTESISTFLIQLYVFYLLTYECTPEMKEYAYYLKLLMGYDFLYNLTFGMVISPRPIYPTYGFEVNGLAKYLGIKFRVFCTALTLYSGSMIVLVQLYCLLYRYLVFKTHKNLYYYFISTKCKIGIQIILQSAAIGFGVYYFGLFCLDEDCLIKIVAAVFCPLQIASFILLYLALRTLGENMESITRDTYLLYWQSTILLGVQMLTPFIFVFIPVIVCSVCAYFYIKTDALYVKVGNVGLLSYGLVNSLLTVLFITPFRRHAAKTFVYWWLKPLLKLLNCSKCLKWLKLDDVISSTREITTTRVVQIQEHVV